MISIHVDHCRAMVTKPRCKYRSNWLPDPENQGKYVVLPPLVSREIHARLTPVCCYAHGARAVFVYILFFFSVLIIYLTLKKQVEGRNISIQKEEFEAGLTQPASLHPLIDESKCLGCNACVEACPERNVLGVVSGKARLITPASCIGHGACRTACPFDAISLVFGTEQRGVDIPLVDTNFETNVPGIYIAGELGGMGLIRNAVEQGRQAIDSIYRANAKKHTMDDVYDTVIVGAGPAGISASLAAQEKNMRYVTLEQDTMGGTVSHYPRGKVVMTQPANLPIIGKTPFKTVSKETLLAFWQDIEARTKINIRYSEHVKKIRRSGEVFTVTTTDTEYRTRTVLLAIGRRGTPRKLGVPGEEMPKVVYHLIDPEQYISHHVLIVGGGDSALEAATSIAEISNHTDDCKVSLSYRSEAFSRAKKKNRERVQQAQEKGSLRVIMESNVTEILDNEVILDCKGETIKLKNDSVIICAGGILPTPFLKEIGIEVETKYGTA